MKKIFTIDVCENFFDMLVQHIFSEYEREKISEIKIILPCKRDIIAFLSAFKSHSAKKCVVLPNVLSLENLNEEDLISNLDKIGVINSTKRILLLIRFILEWNKKSNDNFPIDLAYILPSLLDNVQTIQTMDCYQFNGHSRKTEIFINSLIETWNKTLKNLGAVDTLKHKSDYIKNMIASLKEDQHVILVGIGKGKTYKLLIKNIYDLPLGKIILPNLNLKIKEKDWKLLDKIHYQYVMKDILDYLNVDRRYVSSLEKANTSFTLAHKDKTYNQTNMKYIDYIFDTTADLSKVGSGHIKNIEVITCGSREEEAQVISLIMENEGYENVSLVILDKSLATRMSSLSRTRSENYSYVMLLLHSIKILTSNWDSIALLAFLKHKLVTFGYQQEKYTQILSEFEIKILRSFNTNSIQDIVNTINNHENLKYKVDMLFIINKLKATFNLLISVINYSIYDIAIAHLQCIEMFSNINFSYLDNRIGNFIYDFLNACKEVAIKCSLELYEKILMLFLKKEFFSSTESNLDRFSLYHNKVVILAGFYDIPNFQNSFLNALIRKKFNLPSIQEEHGYFLYTIRNLLGASKVYITRLLRGRKPTILSRLEILSQEKKHLYLDWLRTLNTPKCVVPCTQPMPKPQAKVREEKMQVISCSAVEKLIRNPYSFYVEYILNLRQLRDLNFKPSILEFGTMVHSVLERYLYERKSPMSIARKVFSTSQFNFSSMWWVRMQRIIKSFVEFDKARNTHTQLEKIFSYPILHIPVHNNGYVTWMTKLTLLTAKCDRVEYLPSGQVVIVDYKLGSTPLNKEVISGFSPQLILQALAVEHSIKKRVSELAYWKIDYDKVKVIALKDFRLRMQEFQDNLPHFLSNYLKETTPFIASPYLDKFLRFNSYKQLERIGEWL
ncbi:recombinase RecB [Wolbachia endosymbiont of Cruorifilaria tuberocauda]|uniref:PD-(D/E)XK nuclease family protein n=1 Tax=Wolbachia endosymbiont of Cruorifilaria tuberocauda TaxID=1812111 RepID=UPI00158EEDC8|nr:PD-(D/E)XK nuclease family protein [Wolbachia endosymbiont of Cruorifilaria tuberocauda]QKX01800.1 recombinase RecB [Wolbachia endosymbiont of Cruorifilaria tuberocauda]